MNLRVVDNLVSAACAEVHAALAEGGVLLLSGGGTPQPVHARLAESKLPWSAITVGFADERAVPPDDPASNYAQAWQQLLRHVPAQVLRMQGELPPAEAARAYEAVLPKAIDLGLLGLGIDGHTASLFAGDPALDEPRLAVATSRAPVAPHERITLTLPGLARAERLVFLVAGAEKAQALAAIAAGQDLPAGRVRSRHGEPLWLVDRAAASLLD
ncbi:MAG: 6-phosphogluconolactonase [Pseudohongiellaceae bacterium]|jgi:6-phosphogluconolactonase